MTVQKKSVLNTLQTTKKAIVAGSTAASKSEPRSVARPTLNSNRNAARPTLNSNRNAARPTLNSNRSVA